MNLRRIPVAADDRTARPPSGRGGKPGGSSGRPGKSGGSSGRPPGSSGRGPGAKPGGRPGGPAKKGGGSSRPGGGYRGKPDTRPSDRAGGKTTADRSDRPPANRPAVDRDVTGTELERFVLAELRSLPETLAVLVGQHLVMVGRFVEDDPDLALEHAKAARDLAPRVAILRETLGVAAYGSGDFGLALTELKAARRISGNDDLLPLIADCERGLGRPDRALDLFAAAPARLPVESAVELLIVAAGARRDLGDPEAAVLLLQRGELNAPTGAGWLPRLRYAYADALQATGRKAEAERWFALAEQADLEGELEWPTGD